MDAWRSLSRDQKKEYNERAKKIRINGVNLFVREHIAEAKARIIAEVKARTKRSGTQSVPNEYPVCGQPVPKE